MRLIGAALLQGRSGPVGSAICDYANLKIATTRIARASVTILTTNN
jgi:hypothetical protein